MKKFVIFLLLPLWGVLFAKAPVQSGVIDLRNYNYNDGVLALDGEWAVYPNSLLSLYEIQHTKEQPRYYPLSESWASISGLPLTDNYAFGTATYHLKIIAPERSPALALKVDEVNTAHRLLLNGIEEGSVGQLGKTASSSSPMWNEYVAPITLLPGENHLVLQVSNYQHHTGGRIQPILLGKEETILMNEDLQTGSYLFLAGCLFVSAIFALGLFWFRPLERSMIYFSLFSFFYGFYILHFDHGTLHVVFNNLQWSTGLRLELFSFCVTVLFYSAFIKATINEQLRPFFFYVPGGLALAVAILIPIIPIPALTFLSDYFKLFIGFWYIMAVVVLIPRADYSHKLTWVNALGALGILTVFGSRALSKYNFIPEQLWLDVLGNLLFIFSQVTANAIRFGRSYRESTLAALAASRTRDEFLNTISHEFKTPMNAILGMATFLENSELTKGQRDKLQAIKRNGESLMGLINDVLSISEVGQSRMELRHSPMSIKECVDAALKLSKPHLNSDRVNFYTHIDEDVPDRVMGDSSRVKQLLLHLMTNAFKFTEYGEVNLRISKDAPINDQENISFEISDTGSGISKSYQKKLFSLFNQGASGNTRKHQGLGLGLKVVSELIGLMGGNIDIVSKKGFGTLVRFNLLFSEAPQMGSRLTKVYRKKEVDPKLKLLYAEDNPVNQKLVQMMLQNLNLELDLAADGEEAVEMAAQKYYNIIFMDIQMPNKDGIEATREILENSTQRPIIVAITANMAEVDKERCFEVGMNDFMTKPVKQEDLKMAILKWQGLKKYLDDTNGKPVKLSS